MDARLERSKSALWQASESGDLGVVEGLLAQHCSLDLLEQEGFSALGLAIREGHYAVAKRLL